MLFGISWSSSWSADFDQQSAPCAVLCPSKTVKMLLGCPYAGHLSKLKKWIPWAMAISPPTIMIKQSVDQFFAHSPVRFTVLCNVQWMESKCWLVFSVIGSWLINEQILINEQQEMVSNVTTCNLMPCSAASYTFREYCTAPYKLGNQILHFIHDLI